MDLLSKKYIKNRFTSRLTRFPIITKSLYLVIVSNNISITVMSCIPILLFILFNQLQCLRLFRNGMYMGNKPGFFFYNLTFPLFIYNFI